MSTSQTAAIAGNANDRSDAAFSAQEGRVLTMRNQAK